MGSRTAAVLLQCLVIASLLVVPGAVFGLITFTKGNSPMPDHNWPAGSLELGNLKERICAWEGPPMGGGQTQFCYRGDAAVLQRALDLFAKINAPDLRVELYEGPHEIPFLDEDKRVDFTFTVWDPRSFHQLYSNPTSTFTARDPGGLFRQGVTPPTLAVYLASPDGPGPDWSVVRVPASITVKDHRATSNGYTREDASIVAGNLYDMLTSKPVKSARIAVTRRPPNTTAWEPVTETTTDDAGKFELKKLPTGYLALTFSAQGYASRQIAQTMSPNLLRRTTVEIAPALPLAGTLKDTDGKPVPNARIRASDVLGLDGRGYGLPESETTTDAEGRFQFAALPHGYVRLYAMAPGFFNIDSMQFHRAPYKEVSLVMSRTGSIEGILFRPDGTPFGGGNVGVTPPGPPEAHIGKWGGSMNVKPDGTFEFKDVPPGKYFVDSNPNPETAGTDPAATQVEVKPGQITRVEVTARERSRR